MAKLFVQSGPPRPGLELNRVKIFQNKKIDPNAYFGEKKIFPVIDVELGVLGVRPTPET